MNLLVAKKFQEPAQLPDAEPFDKIDVLPDRGIGFIRKRRGNNSLYAGLARSVGERSRINATTGDDPENV